jgi:hypothetical protein
MRSRRDSTWWRTGMRPMVLFVMAVRASSPLANSREQQEIVTLSLQLLQKCLMLINTILVEQTIEREGVWERLSAKIFEQRHRCFTDTSIGWLESREDSMSGKLACWPAS